MFEDNFQVLEDREQKKVKKMPRKITKKRLINIALYYLKRFDTTEAHLRQVLRKRVNDYAYYDKEFDRKSAETWIEEIIEQFASLKYIDDARYAEIKLRNYISAGKSMKYIKGKLLEKGIAEELIEEAMCEQEYNPLESALKLAKKKKIACFREDEDVRKEMRQKDMGVLVRAGFDYDTVLKVLDTDVEELEL